MLAICRNKKMDFSKLRKSTLGTCRDNWGLFGEDGGTFLGVFLDIFSPKIYYSDVRPLGGFGNEPGLPYPPTHSKGHFLRPKDGLPFN